MTKQQQPVCVGHGVDTLYLNVSYAQPNDYEHKGPIALDPELAFLLDDLKAAAKEQEQEIASPWSFGPLPYPSPLMMQPHGAGKGQWSWLLTSPLLNLTISHGHLNGIIAQVRLASQFLWSQAWCGDALTQVHQFLAGIFGDQIYLQISEVHLCADIAGWSPDSTDWQERFLSRAVGDGGMAMEDIEVPAGPDEARRRWKKINALTFGQHKSRLSCIVYNKSLEIRTQGDKKIWMHDLWRPSGWDGETDVWRVEARFKREWLRAAGVEWAYDFLNVIRDLWGYAVGHVQGGQDGLPDGWIRLTVPGTDTNRTRWAVDPAWKVVQAAFDTDEEHPLGELVFQREKEQSIQRLIQQIAGSISSVAAQGSGLYEDLQPDLEGTMQWVMLAIERHHKLNGVSFKKVVAEKRLKLVNLG